MDRQPKNPVTPKDKARIMSGQSKNYGVGNIPSGSFGARAQAAADRHTAFGSHKQMIKLDEITHEMELCRTWKTIIFVAL